MALTIFTRAEGAYGSLAGSARLLRVHNARLWASKVSSSIGYCSLSTLDPKHMDLSLKLQGTSPRIGGANPAGGMAQRVLVRLTEITLERRPKLEAPNRVNLSLNSAFLSCGLG